MDYMMASESVALDQLGFTTDQRDVLPGQAVILRKGRKPLLRMVHPQMAYSPDIFEYVYFARPDSVIDGISVQESRQLMGLKLGDRILEVLGPKGVEEIDVVIPVPETSNVSAPYIAERLKRPFSQGFVKNRYVFRTFIMPGQELRIKSVRRKLNPMPKEFKGKCVLLVDDSIVRGTTSKELIVMAREAGARKVILASCAPPITHPHIYGIDLASTSELIAHNRTELQIAQHIEADRVIFQTLDDLKSACAILSPRDPKTQTFEVGLFCGSYVTPVKDGYFDRLDYIRRKAGVAKEKQAARESFIRQEAGRRFSSNEGAMDRLGSKETMKRRSRGPADLEKGVQGLQMTNGHQSNEERRGSHIDQDIALHNMRDDMRDEEAEEEARLQVVQ